MKDNMGFTKFDIMTAIEALIDEYYECHDPDLFCQEINRIYQVYRSFKEPETKDEEANTWDDYRTAIYDAAVKKNKMN